MIFLKHRSSFKSFRNKNNFYIDNVSVEHLGLYAPFSIVFVSSREERSNLAISGVNLQGDTEIRIAYCDVMKHGLKCGLYSDVVISVVDSFVEKIYSFRENVVCFVDSEGVLREAKFCEEKANKEGKGAAVVHKREDIGNPFMEEYDDYEHY